MKILCNFLKSIKVGKKFVQNQTFRIKIVSQEHNELWIFFLTRNKLSNNFFKEFHETETPKTLSHSSKNLLLTVNYLCSESD